MAVCKSYRPAASREDLEGMARSSSVSMMIASMPMSSSGMICGSCGCVHRSCLVTVLNQYELCVVAAVWVCSVVVGDVVEGVIEGVTEGVAMAAVDGASSSPRPSSSPPSATASSSLVLSSSLSNASILIHPRPTNRLSSRSSTSSSSQYPGGFRRPLYPRHCATSKKPPLSSTNLTISYRPISSSSLRVGILGLSSSWSPSGDSMYTEETMPDFRKSRSIRASAAWRRPRSKSP
mmetsp:Transcript_12475/g.35530  ORF Transcript_12475/g.35530 Transcript_12475/m.35530 type:complete len:235 (+) Transcript_12475:2306-3010(+)